MLPHSPPIPIGATFAQAATILTVTFDRPLAPAALDGQNWGARILGDLWSGPLGPGWVTAGNQAFGHLAKGFPNVGPDVCWYDPPPHDVISTKGVPAATFADYPLVLLP